MALPDNIQNIDVQDLLEKPIWQMTGKEFLALSNAAAKQAIQEIPKVQPETADDSQKESTITYEEGKYVFGLRGICQLFGVARTTAHYYKNTFLKPAIIQHGQKLLIDRNMALRLFADHMDKK